MSTLLPDGRILVPYGYSTEEGICIDDVAYITPSHPGYERAVRFAVPFDELEERRKESILFNLPRIPEVPPADEQGVVRLAERIRREGLTLSEYVARLSKGEPGSGDQE